MHQRHLAGIGLDAEHALTEKYGAQGDPVQPAHEIAVAPAFYAVGAPHLMQFDIEIDDFVVDPGFAAARTRRGAVADHRFESAVAAHFEVTPGQFAAQAARDMEGLQRQDAALFRVDPIQRGIVAVLRHREQAHRVSPEQDIRV